MNRNELSQDLLEKVVGITEKKTREQEKQQEFMRKELEKLGVGSPAELSRQKRKDLFNKIDKEFTSDAEADGTDVEPEDKEALKKEALHPVKKKVNEVVNQLSVKSSNGFLVGGQVNEKVIMDADFPPRKGKLLQQMKKLKKGDMVIDLLGSDKSKIKVDSNNPKSENIFFLVSSGRGSLLGQRSYRFIDLVDSIDEASDPTTGLDGAEERFFRVEVLNGATGVGAVFMVGATNHRGAEQQALFAARDEPDLRNPPQIGGFQLVVDSSVEITRAEFEAGEVAEPVGPKTGRNIPNE